MNDWLKTLVPIFLTAIGALVISLFSEVRELQHKQIEGQTYIYRLKQTELKIEQLEVKCK